MVPTANPRPVHNPSSPWPLVPETRGPKTPTPTSLTPSRAQEEVAAPSAAPQAVDGTPGEAAEASWHLEPQALEIAITGASAFPQALICWWLLGDKGI